ncbi:OmpA family protein, partial [Ruegeria marina]
KTLISGDATPAEGDTVTYQITVTNAGPAQATNVSLTDSLPAGLTATANNGTTATGTYTAGTGVWAIGTLANGASATLTLEGVVDAGQAGNTITNTTTAASGDQTDPGTAGDDLSESVTVGDVILANDDDYSVDPISSFTGGTVGSVLTNDTINGAAVPVDGSLTTIVLSDYSDLSGVTISDNGMITIPEGLAAGEYSIVYSICDQNNPINCASALVNILISEPSLLPIIAKDLKTVLEEDLSITMVQQSHQMGGFADGALERVRTRTGLACLEAVNARLKAENIFFDTDKATIKPESARILDDLAQILGTCEGNRFEISGHTDSDGSEEYNMRLSQLRAEAVLHALVMRGVRAEEFIARGYGESRPIASNITEAGQAANRRVEFLSIQGDDLYGKCYEATNRGRFLDITANGSGSTIDGFFLDERHDCSRDAWTIFEGSLNYLETASGMSQGMMNLSYRRENFTGKESVRGYFFGAYVSQNDVNNRANGEILGLGFNGGIYGASQLRNGIFLDYYLGAAVGRHEFDLDFDRSVGTINASGDYSYFAGFFGAALSGDMQLGSRTVTPSVGFDYSYSPGIEADVISTLDSVVQFDVLELSPIFGGRVYAEVRDERLINNKKTLFALTPRLACYQSIGDLDGVCSIGGSIEIVSANEHDDFFYGFEIDGDWGKGFSRRSITGSVSKRMRYGALRGDVTLGAFGALGIEGIYELNF